MKKQNKKWLTLMLASLCAVSLGASIVSATVQADETEPVSEASTYGITDVFASNGTAGADGTNVAFTLGNEKYARIKRDLAFKWYEAKGTASYLNIEFAFKNLNFTSVTFEVESSSSVATEDKKSVNAVKFTVKKEGETDVVYATVINGEGEKKKESDEKKTSITAGSAVTLALTEGTDYDSFGVMLNNEKLLGEFTHIGANYSDYTLDKMHPLEITAETQDNNEAVILLNAINGQRFDNVKDNKITDTAPPVLVVNEDISGFQYGTVFSLAYEKVDVLQTSSLWESKKYYQYNPADTAVVYGEKATLTTSTYFMDTVYYVKEEGGVKTYSKTAQEGYTETSVISEEGKEYVSIQITLGDDTFNGTKKDENGNVYNKAVYELAWYANQVEVKKFGETETDYIVIDTNTDGAIYSYISLHETKPENVVDEAKKAEQLEAYQKLLDEEAADTYAGSSSELKLPDVEWLIKDNGGYRGLKFTISYRTPTSSTAATASSLAYNNLEIPVKSEGLYEFKIFANDKAGNTMKYYLDGELVSVTSGNIWEIDEIPSFTFEIQDHGIKVEEATSASSRKVEKILNETYSLSGLTVKGTDEELGAYALYRLDTTGYTGNAITQSALTSVKYEDIRSGAKDKLTKVGTKEYPTYFDLYLDIYAEKVALAIGGEKAAVKACFKKIEAINAPVKDRTENWEADNKYNWNDSSKSFTTAEEGEYLILADFWEDGLSMRRASAYKVVIVETEEDVAEGESKVMAWIRNNKVSVILFGVAAVMLILIIVLLLVNPSEETLDDVDKEIEKKKGKNEDK